MSIATAVGNITDVRINKRNLMKLKVEFNDVNGRQHTIWSNWTSKKSYKPGTSIPVKYMPIPGTFELSVVVIEIDNLPQYSEILTNTGIGLMVMSIAVIGFIAGRMSKEN